MGIYGPVDYLNNIFLVFKQYYIYFYIIFFLYIFHKTTNNITQTGLSVNLMKWFFLKGSADVVVQVAVMW